MYQLPKNWAISGNLHAREGYGLPYYHQVSSSLTNAEGAKNVQIDAVDAIRYDDLVMLDLRVSKLFVLGGDTNVEIAAELFNATNENTTLQQNQFLNSPGDTVDRIGEILSPRVWLFVATVNF